MSPNFAISINIKKKYSTELFIAQKCNKLNKFKENGCSSLRFNFN